MKSVGTPPRAAPPHLRSPNNALRSHTALILFNGVGHNSHGGRGAARCGSVRRGAARDTATFVIVNLTVHESG